MIGIDNSTQGSRRFKQAFLTRTNRYLLKRLVQVSYKFPAIRRLQRQGDLSFMLKPFEEQPRRFFHRGSRADLGVMYDTFVVEDYRLGFYGRFAELSRIHDAIVTSGKTPLIVDCGSNIGASIVYFGSIYERAHIVGFEPNADNFRLLTKNVETLNVDIHQAAIGSTAGTVSVVDAGVGEWGYQTIPDAAGTCPRVAISDVVQAKQSLGFIPFIAKIDIEGGEADLFQEPNEWIDSFPLLIIELHDSALPRQRTSHPFLKSLLKHDRDLCNLGPNLASMRNRVWPAPDERAGLAMSV